MVKVSVVMPTYNAEDFVSASIESVRAQSYGDWELLCFDDGSTDATLDVVRSLAASEPRIRLLVGTINGGAAKARNAAIKEANGRYIAFLDSDDLWKPNKLECQLALMKGGNHAFTFSSYDRIREDGTFINTHTVSQPARYSDLLKTCNIGCLTAMYDTAKLGKIYMPDIRKRQDFGLWLRILKQVDAGYPVSESLAQYRVRSGSISANKIAAAQYTWQLYRNVEQLGLVRSTYYFTHYAINGLLNTYLKPRLAVANAM